MNKKYEIMLILRPKLTKEKFSQLVQEIEKNVAGKIIQKEDWGKRKLAYEMKKEMEGHYLLYYVETEAECVDKLNHLVKINNDIIRKLVVNHEEWPYDPKKKPPFLDVAKEKESKGVRDVK